MKRKEIRKFLLMVTAGSLVMLSFKNVINESDVKISEAEIYGACNDYCRGYATGRAGGYGYSGYMRFTGIV